MLVREAKVNNSPSANSLSKIAVKRVHNLHAPNKTRRRLLDKDKKDTAFFRKQFCKTRKFKRLEILSKINKS